MGSSSIISKIAWAVFFGLLVFGVISAFMMIGKEDFKEQFKEHPKKTSFTFFVFSQSWGSLCPYWEIFDGKIQIPYPDTTDLLGLIIFGGLAITLISATQLKENFIFAWMVFFVFIFGGWFIWKILMYYVFLWSGGGLGLTYQELVDLRLGSQARAVKIVIPLLVLTLFTFISGLKFLPKPRF